MEGPSGGNAYAGPDLHDPKEPKKPSFADRLNTDPEDSRAGALYAVADVRLTILGSAQKKNGRKARLLFAALSPRSQPSLAWLLRSSS